MTKKKVGIIWADPFKGNRGVGALAYSALFLLQQIEEKNNINFEFVLIGTKQGCQEIKILDNKISFTGIRGITSLSSIIPFIKYPKYLIKILKLDYVLDIGAGDSFSDIYGERRFYQINFTKKFFRLLGKKQLLLPQTIGPFYSDNVKKEAVKSINKSHTVFARDEQSFNYTKSIASPKSLFENIDMAFFMPFKKNILDKGNRINVGINISGLLWHGGYTGENEFNLKMNYRELMREIINRFLELENVTIFLTPHVVHNYHTRENDYAVSIEIENEFKNKNLRVSPFFMTPIEVKSFISGLNFFTGARMHSCIAAYSSRVPVFPLAYSRKFNGLFGDTLGYNYLGDMVNQEKEKIVENLISSFNKRDALKDSIENQMDSIVNKRKNILIEELSKFLEVV